MEVEVKLYAYLREYCPGDKHIFKLDMEPSATVNQVVQRLEIPATMERLSFVNGHHVPDETELVEGDSILFVTPLEGG